MPTGRGYVLVSKEGTAWQKQYQLHEYNFPCDFNIDDYAYPSCQTHIILFLIKYMYHGINILNDKNIHAWGMIFELQLTWVVCIFL